MSAHAGGYGHGQYYDDYYYDDEAVQWYRTGYDGVDFFVDPVARPGLNRPVIHPQPD